MVKRKDKKNKLIVKPKEETRGEITERTPYSLWADMDRLFNQFRTNLDTIFWNPRFTMPTIWDEYQSPLVDVVDHGDKYEMNVELPGIPKDDINIEVTPHSIEISAEHEDTEEEKGKNWLRRERSSMSFCRSFDLPEEIKTDNVNAEIREGILTIMIPKVELKPRYTSKKVKIK